MDAFLARKAEVLRRSITDYRSGVISLNRLVQNIEGINDVVAVALLERPQVNAATVEGRRGLTAIEKASIEKSLL